MSTRHDLTILQGETWSFVMQYSDEDLTGHSAEMAIKDGIGGLSQALLSSEADDDGTITLGADGTITLAMTAAQTESLDTEVSLLLTGIPADPIYERVYRYDLELTDPDGVVERVLEGRLILRRGVTT